MCTVPAWASGLFGSHEYEFDHVSGLRLKIHAGRVTDVKVAQEDETSLPLNGQQSPTVLVGEAIMIVGAGYDVGGPQLDGCVLRIIHDPCVSGPVRPRLR